MAKDCYINKTNVIVNFIRSVFVSIVIASFGSFITKRADGKQHAVAEEETCSHREE